jgi:hypothetical protein
MENIIIDNESGKILDKLDDRNQELFAELQGTFERFRNELETNNNKAKPQILRLGNRFTQVILTALSKYPLMSNNEFNKIDSDVLQDYYQKYMEFLSHYDIFEVPSTRQLFCAFMRITVSKFIWIKDKAINEELREYAEYINDNIDGLIFASAETGNTDGRNALARAKIKTSGQGMVQNAYETTINVVSKSDTPEQIIAQARKLLGHKDIEEGNNV